MLLAGVDRELVCNALLAPLAINVLTTLFARLKSDRANLADDESTMVQ
jgi:hypothetical protein